MVCVDWDFLDTAHTIGEALEGAGLDQRAFSAWLLYLVAAQGLDRRTVIKRSRLNQTFAYQIFAGTRRPSRDKLVQLAFGLNLNVMQACELLQRGSVSALLPTCRRDVIIAYCLHHGLDVGACDDLLWDLNERTLMQPDA